VRSGASEARVLFRPRARQCARAAHRAAHLRRSRSRSWRGGALLHRRRPAAAGAVLRQHHRAGPGLHGGGALDHALSGLAIIVSVLGSTSWATACATSSTRG
jgi:hypothetical protein